MTGYDQFTPIAPREQLEVRSADGTRLNVEVYGPQGAPTIVLAHGWTCQIAFWVQQIRDLSTDHRVVAYDQRGHGASGPAGPAGHSLAGLADDLNAVLEATLADGEQAVVAGHSMGAMTMISMVDRHPEQVRRRIGAAALISTGVSEVMARSKVVPMPLFFARLVVGISTWVIAQPQRGVNKLSRALTKYASMSRSATRAEVDFCTRIVDQCPQVTRREFARMISKMDLAGRVGDLAAPTTVIAGAKDRLTPPWHTRRMAAALPTLVDSIEVADAGHMTPVQSADVVTGAIRRLAAEHLPARRVDLSDSVVDLDAVDADRSETSQAS